MQWALPWSWIGLALPGVQTSTSCRHHGSVSSGFTMVKISHWVGSYKVALSVSFVDTVMFQVNHLVPFPYRSKLLGRRLTGFWCMPSLSRPGHRGPNHSPGRRMFSCSP